MTRAHTHTHTRPSQPSSSCWAGGSAASADDREMRRVFPGGRIMTRTRLQPSVGDCFPRAALAHVESSRPRPDRRGSLSFLRPPDEDDRVLPRPGPQHPPPGIRPSSFGPLLLTPSNHEVTHTPRRDDDSRASLVSEDGRARVYLWRRSDPVWRASSTFVGAAG